MSVQLRDLIIAKTREIAAEHAIELPGDLGESSRLFGEDGVLDSIALVSLIVLVEQAVEETFGRSVSLADEKALSQRSSPYRTIGTLAAYAERELGAT